MTIHHDKLAYGKLAPTSENLSEDRLAQMLAELNGTEPNGNNGNNGNAENCLNGEAAQPAETSLNGAYTAPDSNKQHKK